MIRRLQFALSEMLRRLGEALPLDQDILAGELAMRIAAGGTLPSRFDAVMEIENLGVAPSAASISSLVQT